MLAKLRRTLTSVLPVCSTRRGQCRGCGECCKLPVPCPFLRYHEDGRSYCRIYRFRPLNCRKYPRTNDECLTAPTCGFYFEQQQPAAGVINATVEAAETKASWESEVVDGPGSTA